MGWTETRAMHRKANGKPDVKAELDAIYEWSDPIHTSKVLKSQIVRGEFCKSVYYAAVERKEQPYHAAMRTDGTDGRKVYCTVVLIEDATAPGFDFMYKDMDEFAAPAEQHCPASILDLLTKTDHEWANEWRKACRKNAEDKAFRAKLARLPIGTEIEWQLDDDEQISIGNPGDRYTLVREQVGKQKRWMLYYPGGRGYVPPKWLNRNNVTIKSQPTAA